eukprot:COSAG01_NODE_17432_length_1152_cov_0.940171_2_plen_81_part_01
MAHEGRYGVSGCDGIPYGCVSVGCGRPHHTTTRCEAAGNHPRHTRTFQTSAEGVIPPASRDGVMPSRSGVCEGVAPTRIGV